MNPPLTTDRKHAESDLPEVQARLEEIVAASGRVQVAQDNLARAQALARDHMADSKVRFLLLRLQEAAPGRRPVRTVDHAAAGMPR